MKIVYIGCSHSTNSYGKSWADFMVNDIKPEKSEDISVSGASNEMFIEKIKKYNELYNDTDLFIFQLTDPSRMLFGLYGNDPYEEMRKNTAMKFTYDPDLISNHRTTNGISYYNKLLKTDDNDLNNLLNSDYKVMDVITNHFQISEYNLKIKIFHTLLTLKSIFDFYNKKVIFFSWFVDIIKLSKEMGYYDIIKNYNILEGCVLDFVKSNNLKSISTDNLHYGTEEHKIIYEMYLKNFIYKHLNLI